MVLASYGWADDARRRDSLDYEARYLHALCGLGHLHRPGQHTELLPAIPVREGPLHFAGDHASVKPAWLQYSSTSGTAVRAPGA
ncbi:hypothetical protein [Streptomyces cinerochromogenes]|uniref:hypothetical protein n=1 Tax=Streptomyces cinerochromogenes TaxID=66422 RepID=UPI003F5405C8